MLITLQNINKSFLDKSILKGINLTVNEKERIGLLGINGVGKTTLLNIISGALEYDEGTLSTKPNIRIGYLKQNEALDTANTLREEIQNTLKLAFDTRKCQLQVVTNTHYFQLNTKDLQVFMMLVTDIMQRCESILCLMVWDLVTLI